MSSDPADAASTATEPGSDHRARLYMLLFWCVVAVVLGAVLWVVVSGLVARARLNDVRGEITQLRTAVSHGDLPRARRISQHVADQTASAHELTSGPAWWVGANLPLLGTPLRTARTITAQADVLTNQILPRLMQLSAVNDHIRTADERLDLTPLISAQPKLVEAGRRASSALRAIRASDPSWASPVSSARRSTLHQLTKVVGDLSGVNRAVGILLPMLGQHGSKRYFIGFLNEAESRGVGGVPGAFAIASADHGRVRFEHFGSDLDLMHVRARVNLGAEYKALYGQDDPAGTFANSDISPDFRNAARIWAGMWQAKTGQRVDGALAIDPIALSYLLAVTGPAQVPGGVRVSAANVATLTQAGQYRRFPGTSPAQVVARKAFLDSIAAAVSERLLRAGSAPRLVTALSRSARERRLLVYSADPAIERNLLSAQWAGALGPAAGRTYTGYVVNNATGGKLDYYLRSSMTYRRTDCADGGVATTTLTLTNTAPRTGLPPYVTIRSDGFAGARPGDNRELVTYYASANATIERVMLEGQIVPFAVLPEGSTSTVTVDVELPAGSRRRLAVTVREPATSRPVQVLRQPRANPQALTRSGDHHCR
ncbi:DUF4012 domain-containing protein [uncultured Jatrophihabitans sp.]|uniref:DUF4012 domain-containing protein n=1 Tax=uncultured Jatrophihabitans sp. TaxID=1610747 RepID=UPI0035CB7F67